MQLWGRVCVARGSPPVPMFQVPLPHRPYRLYAVPQERYAPYPMVRSNPRVQQRQERYKRKGTGTSVGSNLQDRVAYAAPDTQGIEAGGQVERGRGNGYGVFRRSLQVGQVQRKATVFRFAPNRNARRNCVRKSVLFIHTLWHTKIVCCQGIGV